MAKRITVAVSGHFDPLHIGHLIHFKKAKALGNFLIVLVNTDESGRLKRGFSLLPQCERMAFIRELPFVNEVVSAIDDTDTVAKTLELVRPDIFAKGGDRDLDHMPKEEIETCNRIGCKIITGIGESPPYHSSNQIWKAAVEYEMSKNCHDGGKLNMKNDYLILKQLKEVMHQVENIKKEIEQVGSGMKKLSMIEAQLVDIAAKVEESKNVVNPK